MSSSCPHVFFSEPSHERAGFPLQTRAASSYGSTDQRGVSRSGSGNLVQGLYLARMGLSSGIGLFADG
jgi:hypothetical protein